MQLIINNNNIVAAHRDDRDVIGRYPDGCEIWMVPDNTDIRKPEGGFRQLEEIIINDPWPQVRTRRNQLLTASDWTQMPDSPLSETDKTNWANYRQALRDLPADQAVAATYLDITWPDEPA